MDRLFITLPEAFYFTTEIQPQTRDIGMIGHVRNDVFVSYINESLRRFLESREISIKDTIMADLAITYRSEAFYGDVIKCDVAVEKYTKDSCHCYFRFINKGSGKEILRARARIVFFDYEHRERTDIPESLSAVMKAF